MLAVDCRGFRFHIFMYHIYHCSLQLKAIKELCPMRIIIPGAQVPDWFDHRSEGEVLSFWARRKFPAAAFVSIHNQRKDLEDESVQIAKLHLFVNRVEVNAAVLSPAHFRCKTDECHAYLRDLRTAVCGEDWKDLDRYFLEHEWNYVELRMTESEKSADIAKYQCGLYVYRQETNMEDIQFQCPSCTMSAAMVLKNVPNRQGTIHPGSDPQNETEVGKDKPKLQDDAQIDEDIFVFGSSFETMTVTDESQLKTLPPKLHSLRIVGCHLKSPQGELENKKIACVSNLYAIDCPSLEYLVEEKNIDEKISTSWRTLYIHKCMKLKSLRSSENFAVLEHLCMGSSCESLENFPLNHFPKLKTLCIWDLPNLVSLSIPENFQHHLPLESLEIRDCPRLPSFPTNGLPTRKLKSLTISNCIALMSLPNHMASLESLRTLFIDRCPKLDSLPEGGLPLSLSLLSISLCDKLVPKKAWKLNRLHSLATFEIESGCLGMESFPEKDLLPNNLNSLRISKLSSLCFLDYKGLQQLTVLQSLDINCCPKLSSIPDEGLPSSMTSLSINETPLLTRELMYKLEADWDKIDHIPNIRIDEDFISSNSQEVSFIQENWIL